MDTLEKSKQVKSLLLKEFKRQYCKKKIIRYGNYPGVTLEITGKAPLGDPIEVIVRGYKLTLRKNEAKSILVQYLIS